MTDNSGCVVLQEIRNVSIISNTAPPASSIVFLLKPRNTCCQTGLEPNASCTCLLHKMHLCKAYSSHPPHDVLYY